MPNSKKPGARESSIPPPPDASDERALSRLERLCAERGLRMTGQRRTIVRAIAHSTDHPDVETLYGRVSAEDTRIGLATVYRTVRLLEDAGIIEKHDFRDGRARYEENLDEHHDHLIDVQSGRVIEFRNEDIEKLQQRVAAELGFKLVDHRLELYGIPLDAPAKKPR